MKYEVGRVVKSLAGHDKDCWYVIVGETQDRVLVADGKLKKVSAPKKKNILHLQRTSAVFPAEEPMTDEAVKHFLKSFGGNECQNLT